MTTLNPEPKFRANGNVACELIGERIRFTTRQIGSQPSETVWLSPMLVSTMNRTYAMHQGLMDRGRDVFAVEVDKIPDKAARVAEGLRRLRAVVKHLESGSDSWDLPSTGVPKGFDYATALVAIQRFMTDQGRDPATVEAMLTNTATKRGLADREAAIRYWAETTAVAQIILDIEYERKVASMANRPAVAEDLLAEMDVA